MYNDELICWQKRDNRPLSFRPALAAESAIRGYDSTDAGHLGSYHLPTRPASFLMRITVERSPARFSVRVGGDGPALLSKQHANHLISQSRDVPKAQENPLRLCVKSSPSPPSPATIPFLSFLLLTRRPRISAPSTVTGSACGPSLRLGSEHR